MPMKSKAMIFDVKVIEVRKSRKCDLDLVSQSCCYLVGLDWTGPSRVSQVSAYLLMSRRCAGSCFVDL